MAIRDVYGRSIAGCSIAVEGSGCRIDERIEPELGGFSVPADAAHPDLRITVHVDEAPPRPGAPPRFVTPAWELWHLEDGGFHVSLLRGEGRARPVVRSDGPTRRVSFHANEAMLARGAGEPVVPDPLVMPLDQLLLIHHLAPRSGAILHAAGVAVDGMGVAFPGVSGAGKSTLGGLVAADCPDAALLSDERVVVRRDGAALSLFGTPWMGTARVARNASAPLAALVFPARGATHLALALRPRDALRRLLAVASCPLWDEVRTGQVLEALEAIVSRVPAFELRFVPEPGVGHFLRAFLAREVSAG